MTSRSGDVSVNIRETKQLLRSDIADLRRMDSYTKSRPDMTRSKSPWILGGLAFVVLILLMALFSVEGLDQGTLRMQEVADHIREGSEGFFSIQYRAIGLFSCLTSIILFACFLYRAESEEVTVWNSSMITAGCFLSGAFTSGVAGFVGLWVSVRANIRVAAAARRSYLETVQIALLSGLIPAIVVVALVILGIAVLYLLLEEVLVGRLAVIQNSEEIPMMLVGFGFGASFVALFAQLGGGIFTKAADVGADLAGKIEATLPEDDPRNPAVIADLVGDNVGDCAGRGADLFESIAAEIVSAMILGGSLAKHSSVDGSKFVMFPLIIHAFDLIVSSIGVASVLRMKVRQGADSARALGSPLNILKRGFYVAGGLSVCSFGIACRWLLNPPNAPTAWWHFWFCGISGMTAGWITVMCTQYYTATEHSPVRAVAAASVSGHATNVIEGTALGMEIIAVLCAFYLGEASGLKDIHGNLTGGLFGTAVATMGMLSTAVFILAMDFFGPIADNAGGIVEMSDEPERVRLITDQLDAVGNTTKAATKGYAVASALMACFLLFSAFQDDVVSLTGKDLKGIDISVPEVFLAGMLGSMLVFLFCAWTIRAVGKTAQLVVVEVKRQWSTSPDILLGRAKPNYGKCVAIVTKGSLYEMIKPGLLAVLFPLVTGVVFKHIGTSRGDDLLGAKAVAALLMFATTTGVLMSLYLNNAGGAWDNAKKLVETGAYGGKGSDAHKASITGDTVGDPFKDAAGPSLHVLIKLLATVTLVMCPFFVPGMKKF